MIKQLNSKTNKNKAQSNSLRLFLTITVLLAIVVSGYIIIKITGIWNKINSIEKLKSIVEKGGMFSFGVFILLQILQTTVLQVPAIFVTIAGTLVFGPWKTFILSFVAVMIGSLIMFLIGRKGGKKFLNWLCGKEKAEHWIKKMTNGKYLFFLMMVFPLFPDDILCVVAGMTNMSFNFFFWTNFIARGIGIACTVFFGSGTIIPFHNWGLIVWAILIIVVLLLFYFSVKYKDKIDQIFKQFFKKK